MKKSGRKGMHRGGGTKGRGRTQITKVGYGTPSPTRPNVPGTSERETTRPVTAGSGKHRGDRRDMSPTYSGTTRHSARGSNLRADVKTRKR
jgi:hypothetical protein